MRRRMWVIALLVLAARLASAGELGPVPEGKVRVAAVQCYSRMGERDHNRKLLARCIERAARAGAKIVVLPECAVQGYMDPGRDKVWTARLKGKGRLPVEPVGEPVPGPSTRYFGQLAKRHHRKQALWPPGDGLWVTAGKKPVQVTDSPYGRLGLMICFEVHRLPKLLAAAQADIVLYSVGWYGPDTKGWYTDTFPRRYVVPNGFAVVAANWSADPGAPGWEGIGYSCIIARGGKVLAMAKSTRGEEIVVADLPIRHRATQGRD